MTYRVVTRFKIVYTVAIGVANENEATNNRWLTGSPMVNDRLNIFEQVSLSLWNGPSTNDSVPLGTAGY